jgi:hypothetical protein
MNTDPIFSAEAAAYAEMAAEHDAYEAAAAADHDNYEAEAAAYAEMAATSTTAFRWMDQAGL